MGCMQNPKKFLGIKFNGPHKRADNRVEVFGSNSWGQYRVRVDCEYCGCNLGDEVRSESTMLEVGYHLAKLQDMSSTDIFGKDAIALR